MPVAGKPHRVGRRGEYGHAGGGLVLVIVVPACVLLFALDQKGLLPEEGGEIARQG